jgi:uncharacterized protein (TIGR00369 family)
VVARPDLHQPYGIVHGGVHAAVVETLASVGAAVWMGERGKVVGVSNSTDFYKAVSDGTLTATATPCTAGAPSRSGWSRAETPTTASSRAVRSGCRT